MAKQYSTSLFKEKDTFARVLTIIIVLLVAVIAYRIYKVVMKGGDILGDVAENKIIAGQTGLSSSLVETCRSEAQRLWDDGVTNYGLFWDYDEEMFIEVINSIGRQAGARYREALATLSSFFKEKSGVTLRYAITKSFSGADKAKIEAAFYSALN